MVTGQNLLALAGLHSLGDNSPAGAVASAGAGAASDVALLFRFDPGAVSAF